MAAENRVHTFLHDKLLPSMLSALALSLTLFLFAPTEVYFVNTGEFAVSLPAVLRTTLPMAVAVFAALMLLTLLLPLKFGRYLQVLTLALAVLFYVQGNFFVWDYGRFDGSDINWSRNHNWGIMEIIFWAAIIVFALLLAKRLRRVIVGLALAILLLQSAALVRASFASDRLWKPYESHAASGNPFRFSKDKNVLLIILDGFQATVFERVLERSPEFKNELEGFIYYPDALGMFPSTYPSIPAMLTGKMYDNSYPFKQFLKGELWDRSLPEVLNQNGFRSELLTERDYCEFFASSSCRDPLFDMATNLPPSASKETIRMMDVVLFRYLPHFAKMRVYNEHTWFLQSRFLGEEMIPPQLEAARVKKRPDARERANAHERHVDSLALAKLFRNSATNDSEKPTFILFHSWVSHMPYVLSSSCDAFDRSVYRAIDEAERFTQQASCALKTVFLINHTLQRLGIYDDTTVIVTADHGSPRVPMLKPTGRPSRNMLPNVDLALPLFLLKPRNSAGAFRISPRQISVGDIPVTVTEELGIEADFPGVSVLSDAPPSAERRYYHYVWGHKYWKEQYLPTMTEYRVVGPVRDYSSWKLGRILRNPNE